MALKDSLISLDVLFEAVRDLFEMPHVSFDADVGSEHFGTVDFQIEKYPISSSEYNVLMRAMHTTGVIAKLKNTWIHFGADGTVSRATPAQVKALPHLPEYWPKYMINVE